MNSEMREQKGDTAVEDQVRITISQLDKRIKMLIGIRTQLEKMVTPHVGSSAHSENSQLYYSINSQIIFQQILDELKGTQDYQLSARELFLRVQSRSSFLKYATFRSYLHRMKKRGLIVLIGGAKKGWRLAEISSPT